jgi:hypothetical protein
MPNTQFILSNPSNLYSSQSPKVDWSSLVKTLPEDAELYLRLAEVYNASSQKNIPGALAVSFVPIPAFRIPHRG